MIQFQRDQAGRVVKAMGGRINFSKGGGCTTKV